jgi:hypothetical protein
MPKCEKCNQSFPRNIIIDGKQRNLQNRKFCLSCSPFGLHNTIDLKKQRGICIECSEKFNPNQKRGSRCWVCANKLARNKKADRLYALMGDCCWLCGYSRCRHAMDFHHYDETKKQIQLTFSEMSLSWERIWNEAKKCVLLCAICHREYHAGIINHECLEKVYFQRWAELTC